MQRTSTGVVDVKTVTGVSESRLSDLQNFGVWSENSRGLQFCMGSLFLLVLGTEGEGRGGEQE